MNWCITKIHHILDLLLDKDSTEWEGIVDNYIHNNQIDRLFRCSRSVSVQSPSFRDTVNEDEVLEDLFFTRSANGSLLVFYVILNIYVWTVNSIINVWNTGYSFHNNCQYMTATSNLNEGFITIIGEGCMHLIFQSSHSIAIIRYKTSNFHLVLSKFGYNLMSQ